tara:strand:+ start:282 stop:593 length:312 start_codon:yes stop_codon:yes gene_type:complete
MSRDEYLEKFNNTEFNFEMFTPEGNNKVKDIISETLYKMFYDGNINRKKLISFVSHKINEAYSDKSKRFREIHDSEPEGHVAEQVSKAAKETGFGWKISRFDW